MYSLSWLAWNLLLAVIPLGAAYGLVAAAGRGGPRWLVASLAFVWLAFLPNAPYLLTEWRHFLFDPQFQQARDQAHVNGFSSLRVVRHALFFLGYSGFGVACFVGATRPVARLLARRRPRPLTLAAPFFFLMALAVYMGLIVRLNSWDLATRPGYVLAVAAGALMYPPLLATIVAFALALAVLYLAVDIWIDGFQLRLARLGSRRSIALKI